MQNHFVQKEFEIVKLKLAKSKIAQIKSIAELQNMDFDDAYRAVLDVGISFKSSNFLLTDRELKIRTLDNMLTQIYPLLYKKYLYDGLNVPIFSKIVQMHTDITACFVQQSHHENFELIGMQMHEIIKYCKFNFNNDFKMFSRFIFNMPRTKLVKALYKVKPDEKGHVAISNSNNDKFEKGCVTKGKYKKLDGSFGEAQIDFPPLKKGF